MTLECKGQQTMALHRMHPNVFYPSGIANKLKEHHMYKKMVKNTRELVTICWNFEVFIIVSIMECSTS
jgi:hypothetical protein